MRAEIQHVGTIDDLAHESETEAEVLRAVAHMAPTAARELLLRLLLKIQRSCDALPAITWTPAPVSPTLEQPAPAADETTPDRSNRTQAIRDLLSSRGPLTRAELYDELARLFGLPLAEVKRICSPLLSQLKARRQVDENVDGWLSLATVMRVA